MIGNELVSGRLQSTRTLDASPAAPDCFVHTELPGREAPYVEEFRKGRVTQQEWLDQKNFRCEMFGHVNFQSP